MYNLTFLLEKEVKCQTCFHNDIFVIASFTLIFCVWHIKNNVIFCVYFLLKAGGKAGKDSGKAKAKAVSRSARAGLQVSILIKVALNRNS